MTQLTPRQRLAVYKRAAMLLAHDNGRFPGLCEALSRARIDLFPSVWRMSLAQYSELYAYKPDKLYRDKHGNGLFWFEPYDTSPRIAILLCAIEDVKRKL